MPDQEKERRWAHGHGLTLALLDEYERVCQWLETQPNHAAYPSVTSMDTLIIGDDYLTSRLRRYVRVLFWASGYGWRKRKNWRERLDELRAELAAPLAAEETTDG